MRRELWTGRQKWISVLALTCSISIVLRYAVWKVLLDHWFNYFDLFDLVHCSVTTLLIFLIHMCYSLDTVAILLLIGGAIIGFVSGPLYFPFSTIGPFRNSERWHNVTRGANFGFAILVSFFVPRFTHLWCAVWPLSGLVYMLCVFLVHVTRSTLVNRSYWRTSSLSFFTGFVFGPFCILFKRSFPEAASDEKLLNRLLNARWLGNVTLLFGCFLIMSLHFRTH